MGSSGVIWVQGDPSHFENWAEDIRKKIFDEIGAIMQDVMAEAADKMREFISTRGLPNSQGAGRILTGNMIGAVADEVNIGGDTIEGTFGWLANGEVYFLAQEEGALLWNGGVIMPMLAMYDAGQWAIQEFVNRLKAVL